MKLFPDDIVCCGPASVFVPYTDPGLRLSQVIRNETTSLLEEMGTLPSVILLENHGPIILGRTAQGVKAAMFMADKAAQSSSERLLLADHSSSPKRISVASR
jgi:rhamnose utilization protein RhaD (predicted bifunctional aldolase and dehydrogenase)